jgi:hypothetical protein
MFTIVTSSATISWAPAMTAMAIAGAAGARLRVCGEATGVAG